MKKVVAFAGGLVALAAAGSLAAEDAATVDAAALTHLSCKGAPNEIKVIVRNVKKAQGLLTADLFLNKEEGFLKKAGRIGRMKVAAKSPVTVFCIAAPSSGQHAVAVYHDRNANTKFDKTTFGLPAEPYGVSNNPKMRFAPPRADEASFDVEETGAVVEITLRS
jgi:uncharacterized protein (DUF2141 family)